MVDRRDEITAELFETLKALVPADHAFRNKLEVSEKIRPAILIFDGDEDLADDVDSYGRHRPPGAQRIMMDTRPEIYVFTANKDADEAASELSALRAAIIKAIYASQTLVALCANGDIRYLGYATGFANARVVEAEAGVQFSFRYVLTPSQL